MVFVQRLRTIGPRLKPFDTRTVRPPPKVVEDFYGSTQWKTVASAVRKRDKYACVKCGNREGRLYVDHITERSDGGAELDPNNLQTLCSPCHGRKGADERVKRGNRDWNQP